MFKKSLMVLMVILNVVFLQDAFADTNFSAATPDVLIILDLSESMNWNPQDIQSYIYGNSLKCEANTTACNHLGGATYTYSSDPTCTVVDLAYANPADVPPLGCGSDVTGTTYTYGSEISCHANSASGRCGGSGSSTYIYAHDATCTAAADTTNKCSGTGCSGHFCKNSKTGCNVNCDCSGGFCKTAKAGCAINCNCSGGMCHGAKIGCAIDCGANNCQDGFCKNTNQSDCQTNCSKIEIAKRALAALLDDTGDGIIDSNDHNSLAVRIAYMRYVNSVINTVQPMGSPYSQVFCGTSTDSPVCNTTYRACTSGECMAGADPGGLTPLAQSLRDAKTYLDGIDNSSTECRQKSVILITDGSDTLACGGGGMNPECASGSYQRRRQSVAAAKYLNDSGYKLYVIGFGASMPLYLTNTLNWMAYLGGTNNPSTDEQDTGNTAAYDPTIGGTLNISLASSCPTASTTSGTCQGSNYNNWFAASQDPGNTNLAGYAFMAGDADLLASSLKMIISQIKASAYSFSQSSIQATRTKDENYIYEASFYPVDKDPFWIGHLKRYSICTADLSKQGKCGSGIVVGDIIPTADWDAGVQSSGQSNRKIFTYKNNGRISFVNDPAIIANADLGLTSDSYGDNKRNAIFTFFTTGETNTVMIAGSPVTYTNWMLGDIYHFSPVTIGEPNQYYVDAIDKSSGTACATISTTNAYAQFYCQHTDRTSAGGKRIILAGANDGQFHAFKAAAKGSDGGGTEMWSFIPPNFLPSLQLIAHTGHPTALTHTYFVDGSVGAFDVWWQNAGTDTTGADKKVADWHTLAVINEGRGGNATNTLWSQSASCDNAFYPKGFNSKYVDATNKISYPYYCGYWALDVSDTTSLPTVQWRLGTENDKTATSVNDYTAAAHLGDSWSKMVMGRVKISGKEKWVGFIGGGYSGNDCSTACSDLRGKGFYIVDLKDGSILWKWTNSTVSIDKTKTPWTITATSNNNNMDYDLASIAGIIDTDGDGFIDTVYIGDAGGNVWRFNFCSKAQGNSCDTSNWNMAKLYNSNNAKTPIYTIISSTSGDPQYDAAGTWWLFFGTGDITNPNKFSTVSTTDKFFAVKDIDRGSSVVIGDLKKIDTSTFNNSSTGADKDYKGFYINLNHTDTNAAGTHDYGEKMMANPTIFEGVLFFSTYLPKDACLLDGTAYIYAIDFNNSRTGISGAGLLKDSVGNATRSLDVGTGVTSSPIVSYAPNLQGADVFISTSQTSNTGSLTQKISLGNLFNFKKSKLLYWHDMRVQ